MSWEWDGDWDADWDGDWDDFEEYDPSSLTPWDGAWDGRWDGYWDAASLIPGGSTSPSTPVKDCPCCPNGSSSSSSSSSRSESSRSDSSSSSGSDDGIVTPCCDKPIPRRLKASFIGDCGTYDVLLEYNPVSGIWESYSGPCMLTTDDCDGCEGATHPCWFLSFVFEGSCVWKLVGCNAVIEFNSVVTVECDPFLLILENNNPIPCPCIVDSSVVITGL